MDSQTFRQFQEEIKQAINDALRTSSIGTVLSKYRIPDNAITWQYTLDTSKLQLSGGDASQEGGGWLEGIQKPQVKLADCTIVWYPDCIPAGCYICI